MAISPEPVAGARGMTHRGEPASPTVPTSVLVRVPRFRAAIALACCFALIRIRIAVMHADSDLATGAEDDIGKAWGSTTVEADDEDAAVMPIGMDSGPELANLPRLLLFQGPAAVGATGRCSLRRLKAL